MPQPSPRSAAHEAVMVTAEWIGIAVFLLLTIAMSVSIYENVQLFGVGAWVLLLGLLPGFIAGNLFTGFGHFFADNFGSVETPILGHTLIFRFRQHHEFQTIICQLTFRELNGGLVLAMLPFMLVAFFFAPIATSLWGGFFGVTALVMGWTGAATNQIHRWSHDQKCPAWVRPLQKTGIFLSPRDHAVHHRAPHHLGFCITNNWLNPMMDDNRIWHRLADLIAALGMPQADESVMGSHRSRQLEEALKSK